MVNKDYQSRNTGDFFTIAAIGVGAQSTLGEDIFAGKYMHEKLTKCQNFTIFSRKIFFPNFGGKCPCPPSPTPMIAAMPHFVSCHCRPVQRHLPTFAFSQIIGDKDACFLATLILL